MKTLVTISMSTTIDGKVYTVRGSVELRESYFEGFANIEFPISIRAGELAEALATKIEKGDYSRTV